MGVDENRVVPLLQMLLKEPASTWLMGMPKAHRRQLTSWEEWKKELTTFRAANYENWRPPESFTPYFAARTRLQRTVFGEDAKPQVLILDILSGLPGVMQSVIKSTLGDKNTVMLDLEPSLTHLYHSTKAQSDGSGGRPQRAYQHERQQGATGLIAEPKSTELAGSEQPKTIATTDTGICDSGTTSIVWHESGPRQDERHSPEYMDSYNDNNEYEPLEFAYDDEDGEYFAESNNCVADSNFCDLDFTGYDAQAYMADEELVPSAELVIPYTAPRRSTRLQAKAIQVVLEATKKAVELDKQAPAIGRTRTHASSISAGADTSTFEEDGVMEFENKTPAYLRINIQGMEGSVQSLR
ncbi:hypothetical protein AURDEDRAFT_128754 [Auricularia subglabra TFB-10046 SS5]|nr:hypothetical protein AURDEDRAFT_128754 [Auricularia subglabra TFB-10046 SS5]